jgi:DNA replication protein DnaC
MDADLLVLDELGAHRLHEWVQDTITAIITHRCNNRLPTIVTTNLSPDEGEEMVKRAGGVEIRPPRTLGEVIGLRARSRLFEMCRIIRMPAVEDYRVKRGR